MEIRILSKEGDVCKLNLEPESLVEKLKYMALGHFGASLEDPIERNKALSRFRLIHIKSFRQIDDKKTLSQEGICDNDEILLTKKPPVFFDDRKDFSMGPGLNEILVATATLPLKNLSSTGASKLKPYAADFFTEIKSVLITLIQTSHELLCLNTQAPQIFEQLMGKSQNSSLNNDTRPRNSHQAPNSQLNARSGTAISYSSATSALSSSSNDASNSDNNNAPPGLNRDAVKLLVEMGFNEKLAIKALLMNKMDSQRAAEWLLENPTSSNALNIGRLGGTEPGTQPPSLSSSPIAYRRNNLDDNTNAPSYLANENNNSLASQYAGDVFAPNDSHSETDYDPNVLSIKNDTPAKIIRSFRAYKQRQFEPDARVLASLKEMGFDEHDILQALALFNNSEDEACEWLLQDRKTRPTGLGALAHGNIPSSQLPINTTSTMSYQPPIWPLPQSSNSPMSENEFRALSPSSPVCKALLSDPTILLGLNNPKMLVVLLNMYESFVQTRALHLGQWFNDPDAAVLLSQIFRIYHAEKYSLNENNNDNSINNTTGAAIDIDRIATSIYGESAHTANHLFSHDLSSRFREDLQNTLMIDPSYHIPSPHSNLNIIAPSSSLGQSADMFPGGTTDSLIPSSNLDGGSTYPTAAADNDEDEDIHTYDPLDSNPNMFYDGVDASGIIGSQGNVDFSNFPNAPPTVDSNATSYISSNLGTHGNTAHAAESSTSPGRPYSYYTALNPSSHSYPQQSSSHYSPTYYRSGINPASQSSSGPNIPPLPTTSHYHTYHAPPTTYANTNLLIPPYRPYTRYSTSAHPLFSGEGANTSTEYLSTTTIGSNPPPYSTSSVNPSTGLTQFRSGSSSGDASLESLRNITTPSPYGATYTPRYSPYTSLPSDTSFIGPGTSSGNLGTGSYAPRFLLPPSSSSRLSQHASPSNTQPYTPRSSTYSSNTGTDSLSFGNNYYHNRNNNNNVIRPPDNSSTDRSGQNNYNNSISNIRGDNYSTWINTDYGNQPPTTTS